MKAKKQLLSIEQIYSLLKELDSNDYRKFYNILRKGLTLDTSDSFVDELMNVIKDKLTEDRFKLYLKIVTNISKSLTNNRKKRNSLLVFLNSRIRVEVRASLKEKSNEIMVYLDTINDENSQSKIVEFLTTEVSEIPNQIALSGFFHKCILALIYMKQKNILNQQKILELLIITSFELLYPNGYEKNNFKVIADAVLSKKNLDLLVNLSMYHKMALSNEENYKLEIREHQKRNLEQGLQIKTLSNNIESYKNSLQLLTEDYRQAILEVDIRNRKIDEMEGEIEFESHQVKVKMQSFENNFKEDFYRKLRLELDALDKIKNHLDGEEKDRLERRISNLRKLVDRED